ncbi:MAG: prepilin-type N-terminal cleavage/methylation domain-containing protein [Candidatus Omnitrophica bacterium]|nr:prepilin-type N-terminal cleavage/methylation domain-containing protein [Candidatus Omnitrophota bacterium]
MMIFTRRTGLDSNLFSHQTGFTLLEVLITIVLLVVGLVSVLEVFSVGIFADADVENHTTALYLAQEKMEEVHSASSYAAIDDFASARTNLGGDFADFDREVTVSGDPRQVNVIVAWDVKGVDQSINLVSLFTDYDY